MVHTTGNPDSRKRGSFSAESYEKQMNKLSKEYKPVEMKLEELNVRRKLAWEEKNKFKQKAEIAKIDKEHEELNPIINESYYKWTKLGQAFSAKDEEGLKKEQEAMPSEQDLIKKHAGGSHHLYKCTKCGAYFSSKNPHNRSIFPCYENQLKAHRCDYLGHKVGDLKRVCECTESV